MYCKMNIQDVTKAYDNIRWIIKGLLKRDKIDFEVCPDAPNTYKAMRESYEKTLRDSYRGVGYFRVYGGGDHGVLGREANIQFRALHDAMHYKHNLSFKFEDEKKLSDITKKEFMLYAYRNMGLTAWETYCIGEVINAEIRGQIEYYEKHGQYVSDQTKFILEYLGIEEVA